MIYPDEAINHGTTDIKDDICFDFNHAKGNYPSSEKESTRQLNPLSLHIFISLDSDLGMSEQMNSYSPHKAITVSVIIRCTLSTHREKGQDSEYTAYWRGPKEQIEDAWVDSTENMFFKKC